MTKKNRRSSSVLIVMLGLLTVTMVVPFSTSSAFTETILKSIPGGTIILGADLIGLAKKFETGIRIGPLVFIKENFYFSAVFLFPFMVCLELYFRGILFLTLKKYIHWAGAIAVASIVQSISRRTPHSLIMGSIGGVLMQRYDNMLAPSFMHGFQFFTALGIFLFLD